MPREGDEGEERVRAGVLRGADFRRWEEERGAGVAVRRLGRTSLARRRLVPGDIVIEASGGGPRQPVGRTLLIGAADLERAPLPWICTNFCRQLRVHPEIDPGFVQMVLAHQYHGGGFERFQTQTTNLRNLDFDGFLEGVTLPLPPLAEQQRITRKTAELLGRIGRVRAGLGRVPDLLRRMRQAVLDAACSGRLEEGDEAWETASDLSNQSAPPVDLAIEAALARSLTARCEEFERRCQAATAAGRRRPRRPPTSPRAAGGCPDRSPRRPCRKAGGWWRSAICSPASSRAPRCAPRPGCGGSPCCAWATSRPAASTSPI